MSAPQLIVQFAIRMPGSRAVSLRHDSMKRHSRPIPVGISITPEQPAAHSHGILVGSEFTALRRQRDGTRPTLI